MSWLPRFTRHYWTTCTRAFEAKGSSLQIEQLGFVLEIGVARKNRQLPALREER